MVWEFKRFEAIDSRTLYELMALRVNVFVVEQNCPYEELDGKDFHAVHVLGRTDDGELACYCRILDQGISYKEMSIGRVLVKETHRVDGWGRVMMEQAIAYIQANSDLSPIRISAQAYLKKFYQSLGFEAVSDVYLEDDIPHIEMVYTFKLGE